MQATQILMDEHRVIEQVLSCLEQIAAQASRTGKLDGDAARQALEFLRDFADGCHHGKEEGYLFPLMEAHGFPRNGGPTGVMLHEHELGRRHIEAMTAALEQAEAGAQAAVRQFTKNAQAYVVLLQQHIAKEDRCLFPMADRALAADDQARLLDAFTRVEHGEGTEAKHERLLGLARDLAERYGVPAAATSSCGCECH